MTPIIVSTPGRGGDDVLVGGPRCRVVVKGRERLRDRVVFGVRAGPRRSGPGLRPVGPAGGRAVPGNYFVVVGIEVILVVDGQRGLELFTELGGHPAHASGCAAHRSGDVGKLLGTKDDESYCSYYEYLERT